MSEFFKTSTIWVIDFHYEGRPRRWFKSFASGIEARELVVRQLHNLYGSHARLVDVRRATDEEELQYLRGDEPKHVLCPTGRHG